ncbi:MAG: GNAT family N-acetyltransferase [Gemmatimonadaceae bacterium]
MSGGFPAQPVLRTNRLILRAPEYRDVEQMHLLAGDKRVAEMTLTIPHPYPEGLAEQWVRERHAQRDEGTGVTFAIALPREGERHQSAPDEFIGAVGLSLVPTHRRAELGYWVGVPYWGRGYVTEACAALVEWAFRELRLNRIEARHYTHNPASGRVMQKIGMQFEGVQRRYNQRQGVFRDLALYASLSEPTMEIRANNEIAVHVKDPDVAAEFYVNLLGCYVVKRDADGVELVSGPLRFFLLRDSAPTHEQIVPSFDVPNRAAALKSLQEAGCTTVPSGPHAPGEVYLRDPFGVLFDVIQRTQTM